MKRTPSRRAAPLALAGLLALVGAGAQAGNVSYSVTPITLAGGGSARSINDEGEVAVWVASPSLAGYYVPRVWTGAPVAPIFDCCVSHYLDTNAPLFIDNTGAVRGVAVTGAGAGPVGVQFDRSTGFTSSLGSSLQTTGIGADGSWLVTNGTQGAVAAGSVVTPLPLAGGATQAWGYAASGGTVVGKLAIGGLGYAAAFSGGSARLLSTGASVAYDVNAQGQWVGFVGSGSTTQAVLGGPGGVTVLAGPGGTSSGSTAIALNNAGQVLAGRYGGSGEAQPIVTQPFLYGNGRATRLQDLLPPFTSISAAMDMNEHGQVIARDGTGQSMLLTPQGTLAWAGTTGGVFSDAAHWDSGLGFAPNRFLDVRYDSVASQVAWLDRDVQMLSFSMGSGSGRTQLELTQGALLRSDGSMAIEANGVLGGDGRVQTPWFENRGRIAASNLTVSASGFGIDGSLYNTGVIAGLPGEGATLRVGWLTNAYAYNGTGIVPGRLRVDAGQSLHVEGGVSNFGSIEVFGGQFSHAGPDALVTLPADTGSQWVVGRILARDATLRFDAGLQVSGGQMAFSGGVSDVFGRVEIISPGGAGEPEGQVIVSGRAEVTFWDAVRNNGELRVSAGSTATFFGLVSGAGRFTGSGTTFLEGGFAPGNSPAVVVVEGNLTMGAASPLRLELGGTVPGSGHDKLVVLGTLTLAGGPLELSWWNGFSASLGDRFDLLDWGSLDGAFGRISLPVLGDGLVWDVSGLYVSGEIRVAAVPEPGPAAMLSAGLFVALLLARRRRA